MGRSQANCTGLDIQCGQPALHPRAVETLHEASNVRTRFHHLLLVKGVLLQVNSSNNALASCKSLVSKPSVNQL